MRAAVVDIPVNEYKDAAERGDAVAQSRHGHKLWTAGCTSDPLSEENELWPREGMD
jgi:hypothetical protein